MKVGLEQSKGNHRYHIIQIWLYRTVALSEAETETVGQVLIRHVNLDCHYKVRKAKQR